VKETGVVDEKRKEEEQEKKATDPGDNSRLFLRIRYGRGGGARV